MEGITILAGSLQKVVRESTPSVGDMHSAIISAFDVQHQQHTMHFCIYTCTLTLYFCIRNPQEAKSRTKDEKC